MRRYRFEGMKGGWFVGDFEPTAYRTKEVEVCLKHHPRGEIWPAHYHAVATEINLLVRGQMRISESLFEKGDIFVLDPGEIVVPEFLSDCELVVVKVPSLPEDKYAV